MVSRSRIPLVLVALLVTTMAACARDTATPNAGSAPATSGGPPTTAVPTTNARWTALATSPLANQTGFLTIDTGKELIVCCGAPNPTPIAPTVDAPAPTAAAYDPATDTWRAISAPPTAVQSWGSVTVVGDTVYLLDGGTSPWVYEAYDIATDTWRNLPAPPVNATRSPDSRLGPSAWNGHEIVSVLSTTPVTDHDLAVVAFDPTTERWRTLPSPPTRMEPTSLTAEGDTLTLLGQQRVAADQHVQLLSITFDGASGTWSPSRATGLDRRDPVAVGASGHVVVWDVTGQVRVQDGSEWHDEPTIPFPEDECGWKGGQIAQAVVLWRCTQQGAVLDTDAGTWSVLPSPPTALLSENIVALQDHLVLWAMTTDRMQPYRLDLR